MTVTFSEAILLRCKKKISQIFVFFFLRNRNPERPLSILTILWCFVYFFCRTINQHVIACQNKKYVILFLNTIFNCSLSTNYSFDFHILNFNCISKPPNINWRNTFHLFMNMIRSHSLTELKVKNSPVFILLVVKTVSIGDLSKLIKFKCTYSILLYIQNL